MNDFIKKVTEAFKKPKLIILLGVVGILLIFISSFLPSDKEDNKQTPSDVFDAESYRIELQQEVKRIVASISGDEDCTVVITLESGVRYTYADINEEDISSSAGENLEESSSSSAKSYITVKDANGGERALLVTETMPQVRGVAVVCSNGDNSVLSEKISKAVTAALDITSKRVFVTGGKTYEKR